MSQLNTILEKWNHFHTGPDYHDDDNTWGEVHAAHNEDMHKHYASIENHPAHRHLREYSDSSKHLNTDLIAQHQHGGELHPEHQEAVEHIDSAVNSYRSHKDMHVYTGISFHPEAIAAKGGIQTHHNLHLPAYTSTSIHHDIASGFAFMKGHSDSSTGKVEAHVIKIHVPKGSRGALIAPVSNNHPEGEFLLPRGAKLKVHPTPTKTTLGVTEKHPLTVWHAKLVHDGTEDTRHMNE